MRRGQRNTLDPQDLFYVLDRGTGTYGTWRDGAALRRAREHLVEVDNAVHVRERHIQEPRNLRYNVLGNPTVDLLCLV